MTGDTPRKRFVVGNTGITTSNITTQTSYKTSLQNIVAAETDITQLTLTLPNRTGGKAIITSVVCFGYQVTAKAVRLFIYDNGVKKTQLGEGSSVVADTHCVTITYVTTLSGQIVKIAATGGDANGVDFFGSAGTANNRCYINSLEIG